MDGTKSDVMRSEVMSKMTHRKSFTSFRNSKLKVTARNIGPPKVPQLKQIMEGKQWIQRRLKRK